MSTAKARIEFKKLFVRILAEGLTDVVGAPPASIFSIHRAQAVQLLREGYCGTCILIFQQ